MSVTTKKIPLAALKIILIILLLSVLELGLAIAVLFMPNPIIDITELVHNNLPNAAVLHPLSAILFNYRAYDILLGIVILLLAIFGIRTIYYTTAPLSETYSNSHSQFLRYLILSITMLTGGYVLWAGIFMPGSAFHLGALFASIGLWLRLSHFIQPQPTANFLLRLTYSSGLLIFATIALAVMVDGHNLLQYPQTWAHELILLIEACLALSLWSALMVFLMASPGISLK
jgi:multisubunit Na+/H+ antiporter MnhB subunit